MIPGLLVAVIYSAAREKTPIALVAPKLLDQFSSKSNKILSFFPYSSGVSTPSMLVLTSKSGSQPIHTKPFGGWIHVQ